MIAAADNRHVTNALKAFAIAAVLVNHYTDVFISRAYGGYANSIIAIFFVVSGYGIVHSFDKTPPAGLKVLGNYFLRRCLRLYPLFWLSMVIFSYSWHGTYSLKQYLLPSFRVVIIYWFINAIMQCYVLAPVLYFALKKAGVIKFILTLSFLCILINYIYPFSYKSNEVFFIRYKWILFSHIFLFAMGMALPGIIQNYNKYLTKHYLKAVSFAIFMVSLYMAMKKSFLFANSYHLMVPVFLLSAVFFCLTMISHPPKLPLKRALVLLGTYTYSLYLFHLSYYHVLSKIVWVGKGHLGAAAVAVLLFPIFFLICYGLENLLNKVISFFTTGPKAAGREIMAPRP